MRSVATAGRRVCALLAAGSAGLHAVMLGHSANAIAAGLLAVMITACLYCAAELWRDATVRAWLVVALMNLAMIALHLPAPAHQHGAHAGSTTPSTLMAAATLVAFVEILAAAVALYVVSRARAVQISGTPAR